MREEFDHIVSWLELDGVARWVDLDPTHPGAEAEEVASWTAQLIVDDAPSLARGVEVAAVTGTPCVLPRFGAAADLGISTTVDAVARVSPLGGVSATSDPAAMTLAAHELMTDPDLRAAVADHLQPVAVRCTPERVRADWSDVAEMAMAHPGV